MICMRRSLVILVVYKQGDRVEVSKKRALLQDVRVHFKPPLLPSQDVMVQSKLLNDHHQS